MTLQNSINKTIIAGTKINLGSDASGDMYYRNSAGDLVRVPPGTLAQALLIQAGTIPGWQTLGSAAFADTGTGSGQVPILDGSGLLPTSVMPPITLTSIQVVANQAARLALGNVQPGDCAKQSDNGITYLLSATPASTDSNWIPIGDTSIDAGDIVSGLIATARLGSGSSISTKFLRGDQQWVDVVAGALPWVEITATTGTLAANNSYGANNAGLVSLTLPNTANAGNVIEIIGKGSGGWRIVQNASQTIYFGNTQTTTGTSGYIESTHFGDTVAIKCITANTDWRVVSAVGNLNLV
jgi:hypothetical protein